MQHLSNVITSIPASDDQEKTAIASDTLSYWSQAVFDWAPDSVGNTIKHSNQSISTFTTSIDRNGNYLNVEFKSKDAPDVFRVPRLAPISKPVSKSNSVIQEWEGYVTHVGESEFTARLVDLTDPTDELEEAEFPLDELSRDDKKLLRDGAVFRWLIGYQDTIAGTRTRFSRIVFRRLPSWTSRDLDDAKKEAAESLEAENGDEQRQSIG